MGDKTVEIGDIGSSTPWREAYEEHSPAIFAFLKNRLGNHQDAEDLLQETFVRAIQAEGSLRDLNKIRSYLFTIANNQMINFRTRKREIVVEGNSEDAAAIFDQVADNGLSPEEITDHEALQQALEIVMGKMPESHRQAFQLGVLEQKPYSEIVRLTGWSLSQVKINVYRARKKVIDELRDWWKFDQEM
ncbi:RNA polymerase sigma factor [bacterium]|nr:RNA polymerase sigma factor [bacterium]